MSNETVLVVPGTITRITLNRPEVLNAIDADLGDTLIRALQDAGRSPDVKAIVIEGAGTSFCSGDDRKEMQYHAADVEPYGMLRAPYFDLVPLIRRVPKPVISKVHGFCVAAGMDLMLASDFAIVDPEARFGMIFGHIGLAVGSVLLPKYLGLKRTMEILYRPELLGAQEVYELGLVTKVAAPGELEREVDELASRLAEGQSRYFGQFGLLKEAVNRNLLPNLEEDMRYQGFNTKLNDFYRSSHPAADGSPQRSGFIKV